MFARLKAWRRARVLRDERIPDALWRDALARVPSARGLDESDVARLRELTTLFLHEKRFEGVQGVEVCDAMRTVIALQACLLVLHLPDGLDAYAGWVTVIVHPAAFVTRHHSSEGGIVTEDERATSGLAEYRGPVVLAWEDTMSGLRDGSDGYNVVIHEFAHKLDMLDRSANGAPPLRRGIDPAAWQRDFVAAFEDLRARAARGEGTEISTYGATNAAEFFAVATEAFFEKPARLAAAYPAVYAQLRAYYRQDPATRRATP